jgi:hypothetical protein
MTNVIAKPLGFGLTRRHTARSVPASPVLKKPARQFPAISQHVPLTPHNRSYLRALRQAEMEAWNAGSNASFDTGQLERIQAAEKERRDLRAFGLIALMAVATVMISLWKTPAMAEGWSSFVHLVHQLIN